MPLVAAAAIGAGGALLSSRAQSSAAKSAANASQQATDAAIAEQRRQYDLARQDQMPWLRTGQSALSQLAGLYGLNTGSGQPMQSQAADYGSYGGTSGYGYGGSMGGDMQTLNASGITNGDLGAVRVTENGGQPITGGMNSNAFWQSPDYQFRMNEQMRALTARNAALGIQDSGAAQRAALQYSGNLASGEFNNYTNRLASLAGVGQTAANTTAGLGQSFAGNYGNLLNNNAQNLASSYQQQGAANANLWSSLAGIGAGLTSNWPVVKK